MTLLRRWHRAGTTLPFTATHGDGLARGRAGDGRDDIRRIRKKRPGFYVASIGATRPA